MVREARGVGAVNRLPADSVGLRRPPSRRWAALLPRIPGVRPGHAAGADGMIRGLQWGWRETSCGGPAVPRQQVSATVIWFTVGVGGQCFADSPFA